MMCCGEGEAFYSPMIRSQPFSEPITLDCELLRFLCPPLRWNSMVGVGWSWVLYLPGSLGSDEMSVS